MREPLDCPVSGRARLAFVRAVPLYFISAIGTALAQNATEPSKIAFGRLPAATAASAIQVSSGFKVDLLYTVPKEEQGSWVGLAVDPRGRLYASDQYGGIYCVTLPALGTEAKAEVEPVRVDVGGAHGVLYAFDSLYAMVMHRPQKGIWRLRDTDGDGRLDARDYLREFRAGSEHGAHALVASPDGRSIFLANGNSTDLPTDLTHMRPVAWGEDLLLPRIWDPGGHARGRLAPGGYVARTNPEGKTVELFSIGFRNHYDLAFDANGELFTFDSDMEADQGLPWYMPTRINHVVSGGDYGWRSGSGRWPDYFEDSLPAVLNIGPGSPTGLTFGTGAKFPVRYQRALFAADWTYGTLYAIHLSPDGASYRAEKEEFLAGKPLPLTDVLINPHDGALYFVVGGRRTQSALYRVTYTGGESTSAEAPPSLAPAAKLRRTLETLHAPGTGPGAIDLAWPHLASSERFVRHAARVAIEKQPVSAWADRALAERNPRASVEALIALARLGDKALQSKIVAALSRLELKAMDPSMSLPLLRAWQLVFTRMGKPDAATCREIAAYLGDFFPQEELLVNRELVELLVFLDSTDVVAKTVPLLAVAGLRDAVPAETDRLLARNALFGAVARAAATTPPDRQQISYAVALRMAKIGWTPRLRRDYFAWFSRAYRWQGGSSFSGYLNAIRADALQHIVSDPAERHELDLASKRPSPGFPANAVAPKGPGRNYTVEDATKIVEDGLRGRDFSQGKAMFAATACIVCHRFNGDGGGVGPEISSARNRYTLRDLLENIIDPSAVISDQYGSEQIEKVDGTSVVGRIDSENGGELSVTTNLFTPDEPVKVQVSEIKSRKPFPISLMPPGLINGLNAEELKNLIAYILSGGNEADPMFQPSNFSEIRR